MAIVSQAQRQHTGLVEEVQNMSRGEHDALAGREPLQDGALSGVLHARRAVVEEVVADVAQVAKGVHLWANRILSKGVLQLIPIAILPEPEHLDDPSRVRHLSGGAAWAVQIIIWYVDDAWGDAEFW